MPTEQSETKVSVSKSAPKVTPPVSVIVPQVKVSAPTVIEKESIPPRPKMSELAHDYKMRLEDIMDKLRQQNKAIQDKEMEKAVIDEELRNCTGIFKGKRRKELQEQSDKYANTIKIMKQGLSHIVQDYKYPTVDAFLKEYRQGKSEYEFFVKAKKEWESKYGKKSIHRKLAEKQAEVKQREQERETYHHSPKNRGAR